MAVDSNENSGRVLVAGEADAGLRVDSFLARELGVSRERAKKLLADATLFNAPVKSSYALKAGDEIKLTLAEENEPQTTASALDAKSVQLPPVLFEDEHLIVINKPRGLVVHEGAGETGSTLVETLRAHGKQLSSVGPSERAGIVHRLDKDTSGVLVVCKTDEAHWKLAQDFADRKITKEYSALVCGVPKARGRIEAPIERHPVHRKKMAVVASGRPATTEYSVEKNWQKFALLKVNILTGRTHQIRVHLQYINHPVVGDAVYGGLKRALENAPNDAVREAIEKLNGQALHAAHLAFAHPLTGEAMSIHAPLPEDMINVIQLLDQNEL
jgi:23S rRNA pseudouridine1911/1915/1917 synthase